MLASRVGQGVATRPGSRAGAMVLRSCFAGRAGTLTRLRRQTLQRCQLRATNDVEVNSDGLRMAEWVRWCMYWRTLSGASHPPGGLSRASQQDRHQVDPG